MDGCGTAGRLGGVTLLLFIGCALAACSGTDQHGGPPVAPTSTVTTSSVSLPSPAQDLLTLLQRPVTSGSADAGMFSAHAGDLWIDVNCLGVGSAQVTYSPGKTFSVPCAGMTINSSKNKVHVAGAGRFSLRVDAPDSVRWAILVQQ